MTSIFCKLLPLFLIILFGCHPSYYYFEYRFEGKGGYIKGVPFYPQEENYCGPASLASVLGFWGYKVSQEDVAREVYTPKIKGTITVDMVNYARGKGFSATSFKGGLEKLKEEIDKGHPLILFLNLGYSIAPRRHYIVIVGYDEAKKAIIAYSGRERDILIPYDELLKSWGRTGYWTLVILPKEQ
jgi:ABC-type bacteriocin/lantibiotic exporter with double-glycine peptidase domain